MRPEPILIVPAWIMKYYILDLSPQNSLVKYLVDQGFTVFMISWKNPATEDRDLGMDDYRSSASWRRSTRSPRSCPSRKVHAVGYCLGGTLLAIAAAAWRATATTALATLTLAGGADRFQRGRASSRSSSTRARSRFLEDLMGSRAISTPRQMAGAFQLLRSNDLIWSRIVRDYLLGERAPMNDLMAWNADATRMPYRMHCGIPASACSSTTTWPRAAIKVDGRPVALTDIRVPIFAVGTETDHVAPWRSVFKIHC